MRGSTSPLLRRRAALFHLPWCGGRRLNMRPYKNARAIGGLGMAVYYLNRKGELVLSLFAEEPRVRRRDRPRCGARTRKAGHVALRQCGITTRTRLGTAPAGCTAG